MYDDLLRIDTGIQELNRVLGGGMVSGALMLLAGDPGIGKSTLTMQVAGRIKLDTPILYVSGEESRQQLKMRAQRLGAVSYTHLMSPIIRKKFNHALKNACCCSMVRYWPMGALTRFFRAMCFQMYWANQ